MFSLWKKTEKTNFRFTEVSWQHFESLEMTDSNSYNNKLKRKVGTSRHAKNFEWLVRFCFKFSFGFKGNQAR